MRAFFYILLFAALTAVFYVYFRPESHVAKPSPQPTVEAPGKPFTDSRTHPVPVIIDKQDFSSVATPLIPEGDVHRPDTNEIQSSEVPATSAPNTAEIFEKAVQNFDSGDYRASLSLFMDIKETDVRALTGAGLSYFKLGDLSNAIRYLEESIRKGEDNFIERKFLALAYYKRDDLHRSIMNAESALAKKNDAEFASFVDKLKRERDTQDTFINEETMHFKVVFDGYVHGNISRKILEILEDAYRDIGNELNHFPDYTVTVLLFSEQDFFDITRLPAWTAGAYDGKIKLPIRGIEDMDEQFLRTVLYHEYVHAAVHSITSRLPLWINEGIAEYLVNRGYEMTGQMIPLRSLEKEFPMHDQRLMTEAYAESYSAVAFLIGEHGLYRMKEFMAHLSQGSSLNEAFMAAFYTSYDEFVSTWGKS